MKKIYILFVGLVLLISYGVYSYYDNVEVVDSVQEEEFLIFVEEIKFIDHLIDNEGITDENRIRELVLKFRLRQNKSNQHLDITPQQDLFDRFYKYYHKTVET